MKNYTFLYIIAALLLYSSCKGTKNMDLGPIPIRTDKEIIKSIQEHNISYQWFAAEGKMIFDTPQENGTVKGYLRMKRDSAIWIVFKKLRVEAARVLIKPDSFFVLYRLEQKFEKGATSDILSSMNVKSSFGELQDYLIGNIPEVDTTSLQIYEKEKVWLAETNIDKFLVRLRIDPNDLKISGYDMFSQKNEKLSARYEDFKEMDEYSIPYKREFTLDLIEYGYNKVKMELKKIEINVPMRLKFSIPSHYEEIHNFR